VILSTIIDLANFTEIYTIYKRLCEGGSLPFPDFPLLSEKTSHFTKKFRKHQFSAKKDFFCGIIHYAQIHTPGVRVERNLYMEKKRPESQASTRREQMIAFIIRTIQSLDEEKLRNIYHLVLHIK